MSDSGNYIKMRYNKPNMKKNPNISLNKAIELGEYDPKYLSNFKEWKNLSPHGQLQLIRKGLDTRRQQLTEQWAEINNVIDFRLKPELKETLKRIEEKWQKLEDERIRLYEEYSEKM